MRSDAARWNWLVPALAFALCSVAIAGSAVYGYVEKSICAPENYNEGMCFGTEADAALEIVMHVFIGLAALVVEAVTVAIAPSEKRQVALVTLVAGSVVALALGLLVGKASYAASAMGAGLLGWLAIEFWLRRSDARA